MMLLLIRVKNKRREIRDTMDIVMKTTTRLLLKGLSADLVPRAK